MEGILVLVLLLAVIIAIVFAVSRSMRKGSEERGAEIVPYLVLALAMGVSGFALASLARTAFPGDRFIFDPSEEVATALASLVVALPFVIYFWRRQADRRALHPHPAGWTVYLTLIQLVFQTALVISAVLTLDGWIGDGRNSSWPATVVFIGIVVFHEIAARRTPPAAAEGGELPRVVASAIGLITFWIGASGTVIALFGTLFPTREFEFHPWVAMAVVGGVVWGYQWLRTWSAEVSVPRTIWATVVTTFTLLVAFGSVTALLIMTLQYVFTTTPPAGEHFETAQVPLGLVVTSLPIWAMHRRVLGPTSTAAHQFHLYATASVGLLFGIGSATALTIMTVDRSLLVGGSSADVVSAATIAVVGIPVVWMLYSRAAERGASDETPIWPRRLYLLGIGILFGLVGAGGLISALFILLQRFLGSGEPGSVLTPVTIFIYSGLVAWYLLSTYFRERGQADERAPAAAPPFEVTVITSHPGMLATRFPANARLKVMHRGDDAGRVTDEMADEIVAQVNNRSSWVWVDDDGFRVAPVRPQT